jgi:hypothetical protein
MSSPSKGKKRLTHYYCSGLRKNGFSDRPAQVGVNYQHVAGLWHRLMRGLGYERYGAQG